MSILPIIVVLFLLASQRGASVPPYEPIKSAKSQNPLSVDLWMFNHYRKVATLAKIGQNLAKIGFLTP